MTIESRKILEFENNTNAEDKNKTYPENEEEVSRK
jgi:hypothetical protein